MTLTWSPGRKLALSLHFLSVARSPDQQQILNGKTDIKILRHKDQPWARPAVEESRKVCRHGLAVMRNQTRPRSAALRRTSGSGRPITPAEFASSKSTVEVWVSLEPRPHVLGVGVPRRAASSLE